MKKSPPSLLTQLGPQEAMVSFAENPSEAFSAYGRALDKMEPIQFSKAAIADQFRNIDSNLSIRSGMSRLDYEFFRPAEAVPRLQKQIIAACMSAYDKIGIIRNVIDTMSDFASQGVRWYHPNAQIQEFYDSWSRIVNMPDRSERFLSLLYRAANVPVKRSRGKLRDKEVDAFKRGVAAEHIDYQDDFQSVRYREIPLRYTILNPLSIDVAYDDLSTFTGFKYYTLKLSPRLISIIQNPRDAYEAEMVNTIPSDITNAVRNNQKAVKLSDDDLVMYHYKKDDWLNWANPMTYAILDDLIAFEKMKLADLAALDGAISHIRIWKLGSLEHKILPTDGAIQKLSDLLLNNVGGGSMDLIWGPDLELSETSTEIYKFLGSSKYENTLMNIYGGLGVPPTMTGASAGGGGFNNNFISLKTLTERLKYGRAKLTEFWNYEARLVQKAMRFKEPPTLLFDHMNLSDEVAEKALWIQLLDRAVISDESLQERFGVVTDVERKRLDKEYGKRKKGALAPKAGPFFDGEPDLSLEKIFAQRGSVTPSEVGLELDPRKKGEKTVIDIQDEANRMRANTDSKGVSGQGRPLNKKDSQQRKKRTTMTSKAESEELAGLLTWAESSLNTISEVLNPIFLQKYGKANMRQLTDDESAHAEHFKATLLYNLEPYSEVTEDTIANRLQKELPVYKELDESVNRLAADYSARNHSSPSLDQMRRLQCFVYAIDKGDYDGDDQYND